MFCQSSPEFWRVSNCWHFCWHCSFAISQLIDALAPRAEGCGRGPVALRSFVAIPVLCTFLLGGAGCRHIEPTHYPIGLYGVRSTNDFRELRAIGFNTIQGNAAKDYLDAARVAGLKVLAAPRTSAGANFDPVAARNAVSAFDRHPALWAWYLVDEPDLNHVRPEQVIEAHRVVKRAGARKPTALALYHGAESLHYANLADVTMIDRYPVPWQPLAAFGQHVRQARLAVGKEKPLVAVIQAFDWSYYPELLPGGKDLRPPTYEELRCMTYGALAERATGLFFYAFDDGKWNIREHPATWDALRRVVGEVHDRRPLFQAEHLWWPWRHALMLRRGTAFNDALDSSLTLALLRVRTGNEQTPPGHYLLAVNTTGERQSFKIFLPQPNLASVHALAENRSLNVTENWIEDDFAPYAVHVYGPM